MPAVCCLPSAPCSLLGAACCCLLPAVACCLLLPAACCCLLLPVACFLLPAACCCLLLPVACCLLPAACCCLLPAAAFYCLLPAICCLLPAACCCLLPAVACCLLSAACCLLFAACCLLPAACCLTGGGAGGGRAAVWGAVRTAVPGPPSQAGSGVSGCSGGSTPGPVDLRPPAGPECSGSAGRQGCRPDNRHVNTTAEPAEPGRSRLQTADKTADSRQQAGDRR